MAQLMPLPLTVSCFSKIQIGFTFLVPAHPGGPGKGPLNARVCVCSIGNGQPSELALSARCIGALSLPLPVWLWVTWRVLGNVTSAGWQVTLCDPMWHVSSRSDVATLQTAIHLLLDCMSVCLTGTCCFCRRVSTSSWESQYYLPSLLCSITFVICLHHLLPLWVQWRALRLKHLAHVE